MAGGDGRATRVLNVADEPSVALALSSMLTSNQALKMRDESSGLNKIYEFNYTIQGQPCEMLFTSVDGHLMNLDFQDECCRTWPLLCDPVDLYDAPLCKYVPEDKLDIKRRLQDEARNCQWLVLWLHCDADGENIAFEVVEVCKEANPQLDVWRARFSALIDREIQESVQKLTRPNQSLADVVDVRKEIDLRVGASFTSFQTTVLKRMLDLATGDEDLVLSYDRCQFFLLLFVMQRLCIIESHEPNELWTINCSHKSAEGTATFDWLGRKLSNKTRVEVFFDMCVKKPTATVTKARVQEKLKYPPRPLNIVELQKRALRYFEMSSEQTMKVAVDLYQAGFISYPRTETDFFSERTDLKNLYELVVRHFLACVSQPAIEVETTVDIGIAGESFVASGRMLRDKNYLDVYRFESWGGSMIPSYTIGQQFTPTMTLVSSVTRPLPLLHEADLLTFMDQAGIGNDAPMHDHIKKLLDGLYATKDSDTRISPTNLGKEIVMAYEQSSRAPQYKLQLRMWTEHDMKAIKIGTNTKAQVLKTSLQKMKECFLDYKNFAWRPTSIFKEAVDQKVMSDLLNAEEMWMGVRTHIHAFRGSQKVMPRRNLAV